VDGKKATQFTAKRPVPGPAALDNNPFAFFVHRHKMRRAVEELESSSAEMIELKLFG
jgi:hypothetical protein